MTIYRVQDKEGRGPWRPGMGGKWMDKEARPHDERLVSWIQQFGLGILRGLQKGERAGCGCETLNQLQLWFSRAEIGRLKKLGYAVVKMEGRPLAQSSVQVVFAKVGKLQDGVEEVELYGK